MFRQGVPAENRSPGSLNFDQIDTNRTPKQFWFSGDTGCKKGILFGMGTLFDLINNLPPACADGDFLKLPVRIVATEPKKNS